MASDYWIKLYLAILDDPKMALLPDRLWRRAIEMMLLAGRFNLGGDLPDTPALAWILRVSTDELALDLSQLEPTRIVQRTAGGWNVTNFAKRQGPSSAAERKQAQRDRERLRQYHGGVTNDVTNCDTQMSRPVRENQKQKQITDTETHLIPSVPPAQEAGGEKKKSPEVDPVHEEMLKAWATLFPDKPQPKASTYRAKMTARLKDPDFREKWRAALEKASLSPACQAEGWFDFEFFVRNDENYQKMLAGWMAWKDQEQYNAPRPGAGGGRRLTSAELVDAAFANLKNKNGGPNGRA